MPVRLRSKGRFCMTAPPDEIVAKVREWAAHADDDLRVAEHTLTLPDECPYRLVAYHAQQCAEKYLKAFLVLRGIDFPFTHNIARLLELCSEHADSPRKCAIRFAQPSARKMSSCRHCNSNMRGRVSIDPATGAES